MKKIIYLLLLCVFQISFAQSDADYEKTMNTVITSLNEDNYQKFFDLCATELQANLTKDKISQLFLENKKQQGLASEFDFMDAEESSKRYLIQSENDSFIIEIGLSSDLKITTFKLE